MKKLIYSISVLLICTSFKPIVVDVFSVIKVIGLIKHSENSKALFTGDKVRSDEKLIYENKEAKAALIHKDKGRFMLKQTPDGLVSAGLLPAMNNISSRAGALINIIDLQNHFSDKFLILNNMKIEVSDKTFPLDNNNFFFLRFNYNGEEISKKLSFENNKIVFNTDDILKIDGTGIILDEGSTATLFYRNNNEKTSTKIAQFEPIFTDENNLKLECKLIANELSDSSENGNLSENISAYLHENYGKIDSENLNAWLENQLGIK